jgi:hypothetical protein
MAYINPPEFLVERGREHGDRTDDPVAGDQRLIREPSDG